ncbi:MAG: GrpB family protein [Chloroflexota bacterium]|nr:GrpB family protein [Chloroflexota bacterium]
MSEAGARSVIGRYEYIRYADQEDAFQPYDARCPEVARRVADLIRGRLPGAPVEHVGSTAVPGCPGKGVVDLMLPYAPGELDTVRTAVEGLEFRLHIGRDPFPPERPVYVGTLEHDGEPFRLHLHAIPAQDPEVATQRRFRDALQANPALVAQYAERKRAVLATGVTDGHDYNLGKNAFIRSVIERAAASE